MSYILKIGKNNEKEIKRIIRERFKKSYLIFSEKQKDIDYSVHELRKNMKKVRAGLRLVRDVTGEDYYKRENIAARDLARTAAELRKRYVMVETMNKMNERFKPKENDLFYPAIYQALEIRHQELKDKLTKEEDFINQTVLKLHKIDVSISDLSFNENGFDAFADGLKRVYKRGQKAKKKAQKSLSVQSYHEWRKRAKYLRYQLRILKNVWPEGLKGYISELHELPDLLGDDHDLHELKSQLHQVFHSEEYDKWLDEQNLLIEKFSCEKRNSALELGEKIYAEKPKAFVKRIRRYWEVTNKNLLETDKSKKE